MENKNITIWERSLENSIISQTRTHPAIIITVLFCLYYRFNISLQYKTFHHSAKTGLNFYRNKLFKYGICLLNNVDFKVKHICSNML